MFIPLREKIESVLRSKGVDIARLVSDFTALGDELTYDTTAGV